MDDGDPPPVTAKLRASHRRHLPRASRACETCRVRKTKCDQAQPCSYCAYHSLECFYRALGANESSSAAKRHAQLREVQRNKSRLSPWPEVNQSSQKSSEAGNAVQQQGISPGIDAETTRIHRISDGNIIGTPLADIAPNNVTDDNGDGTIAATPEVFDSASRDGLSGVNIHTHGTEFYGNSSNLAFLGNLYARALGQAEGKALSGSSQSVLDLSPAERNVAIQQSLYSTENIQTERARSSPNKAQLSIVNLLHNPNRPSHSPRNYYEDEKRKGDLRVDSSSSQPRGSIAEGEKDFGGISSVFEHLPSESQLEIEKMFISSYFSNKHYIHPMLCKSTFMRRCEKEAFILPRRPGFSHGSSKFAGLYFAVVAVGAINASPNETSLLDHYSSYSADSRRPSATGRHSALDFADFYFAVSKQALGDIYESCSLESAQALLLLCVFCQNALRPHSCFMYSGMAVRTAIAIGLASGMSSLPPSMRKEGRRTWWCIYSHEIEMCCSSGRLDSMKELHYYQVDLPKLKANSLNHLDPDAEDDDIAMIPAIVSLARIMSEASHLLYHSTKRTMGEMSQIATSLDNRLLQWKSDLPKILNIDVASLNDPEWAFKQKLVLRLRFYNTRILIHRPFLAASTSNTDSTNLQQHFHICVDAARTSIQMQYESFLHRIYIRTWWYNTTYALYSAMILLHVVLAGFPGMRDEDLLADVEKSLDIFESMNNIIVARRCAEMIREVLEVARACAARRRALSTSATPAVAAGVNVPFSLEPDDQSLTSTGGGGDFFFSLFNQDSQPDTRAEILSNLVDPTILEDFAFGSGGNDFSLFLGV